MPKRLEKLPESIVKEWKQHLIQELESLLERYQSFEQMAKTLGRYPGFETTTRATVRRWFQNPSKRTRQAIEILTGNQGTTIRVAVPETLAVLPALVLAWKTDDVKVVSHPCWLPRWFPQYYGLTITVLPTSTEQQAMDYLKKRDVDLAFALSSVVQELQPPCKRLCAIAWTEVSGIANEPIRTVFDLRAKTLVVPAGYGIATWLKDQGQKKSIALQVLEVEDVKDAVDLFATQGADVVFAPEPFLGRIKQALTGLQFIPTQYLLGPLRIDIAINLNTISPSAVRGYLRCITDAAQYIELHSDHPTFHRNVSAEVTGISALDVRSFLELSHFEVRDIDLDIVLVLWDHETLTTLLPYPGRKA